jgi:hypothetical protein
MATKYSKWLQNIPNGRKIYQHLPWKAPPKITQILKVCHMATLT